MVRRRCGDRHEENFRKFVRNSTLAAAQ